MASKQAVAASLAVLSRAFAGAVDAAKADVYHAALDDLSDDELKAATGIVVKSHTGEFIPPPAVLRKAVAPAPPAVDADYLLRTISMYARYSPHVGMCYPHVSEITEQFGEAVGYAYAAAGAAELFSDNETTRSIARREFAKSLQAAALNPNAALPVIGGPAPETHHMHVSNGKKKTGLQSIGSVIPNLLPPGNPQ